MMALAPICTERFASSTDITPLIANGPPQFSIILAASSQSMLRFSCEFTYSITEYVLFDPTSMSREMFGKSNFSRSR